MEETSKNLKMQLETAEESLRDTEEKKNFVVQKLKKSRREFMTIFDSVPAMIWYRDREGKILRVNQCAADSVGMSIRELVGRNYYEIFPDGAERSREQDLQVMHTGQPLRAQLREFTTRTGQIRWALVDRIPLRDHNNCITGVMVFAQDITEKKRAEDRLVRAKKEIELTNEQLQSAAQKAKLLADRAIRSNMAKSEMLASSSHELRTPMNAIIGFSDLLRETSLDEEQRDYVNTIFNSAQGLLGLINDILDFTKLEAGKLNIEIQACMLKDFVSEIRAMTEKGIRDKGLELIVQIDPRLSNMFYTDPLRLKQCLINLISNAVKFTDTGHVAMYVNLEQRGAQQCIRFDVQDTGVGISKDKQEEIFKSYSQADIVTDRKYGGTGLGLTITKKLTDLLGGSVQLTSEAGTGSTFSIILPLLLYTHEFAAGLPGLVKQERKTDPPEAADGYILLAEGNVPTQLTMNLLLRRAGMDVKTASNIKEVYEKARQYKFDIILLDLLLDDGQGLKIVRRLREEKIKTPIIAIARHDVTLMEEALEAGCNEYLSKPVSRSRLYEVIADLMQAGEFEQKRRAIQHQANEQVVEKADFNVNPSMEWISEMFDETELLKMLPELVAELQEVLDDANTERAGMILDVLGRVADSCSNVEISCKIEQLQKVFEKDPDEIAVCKTLIEELNEIFRQIDHTCENS